MLPLGVAVERAALSLHGVRDGRERAAILQLNWSERSWLLEFYITLRADQSSDRRQARRGTDIPVGH